MAVKIIVAFVSESVLETFFVDVDFKNNKANNSVGQGKRVSTTGHSPCFVLL